MSSPLIFLGKIFYRLLSLTFLSVDPVAIHQETIRITPNQTSSLKAIFFHKQVNLMSHGDKKLFSGILISRIPSFSQLQVSQVMRCIASYVADLLIRENHGKQLAAGTQRMMDDDNDFAYHGVIFALSSIRKLAYTSEINGLPTLLIDFLDRVFDYTIKRAAGYSTKGILKDTDMDDVNSLVIFVKKALLPFYLKLWLDFSYVDFDKIKDKQERDECKGRPDVFLSKIEELGTLKRSEMCQDHQSYMLEWFYKFTCMKAFILDIYHTDLYHAIQIRKEARYPTYALEAINGNKLPLMTLFFTAFEIHFYQYYNKQLIVQAHFASPKETKNSAKHSNIDEEEDMASFMEGIDELEDQDTSKECKVLKVEESGESYINTHVMQILYYILGAALRSALGIIHHLLFELGLLEVKDQIFNCLSKCLVVKNAEDAQFQNLPYQLILERQRKVNALILPSCSIFEIIMDLENIILAPLFTTASAIAALGADFITYVELRIEAEGFYDMIDNLLLNAFQEMKLLQLSEIHINKIVTTFRLKLFNYYVKTATKDLIKFIMRTLNNNKAISRLSFRSSTLLESIEKGTLESELQVEIDKK